MSSTPERVQDAEHHVRQRRAVRRFEMQPALERAAAVPGDEERHALVVVQIRIAHRRSVAAARCCRAACPSPSGRVLQRLEEMRNHAHVIRVQLREVEDLRLRCRCDATSDGTRRRSRSPDTSRFELSRPSFERRRHASTSDANASTCRSNISLTCSENESGTPTGASGSSRVSPLQIEAPRRPGCDARLRARCRDSRSGARDRRPERRLQARADASTQSQNAAVRARSCCAPLLRRFAEPQHAEQRVEHDARIADHRQRPRRRRPADRVGVRARVAVPAAAALIARSRCTAASTGSASSWPNRCA